MKIYSDRNLHWQLKFKVPPYPVLAAKALKNAFGPESKSLCDSCIGQQDRAPVLLRPLILVIENQQGSPRATPALKA
jgi:hypothetical protein